MAPSISMLSTNLTTKVVHDAVQAEMDSLLENSKVKNVKSRADLSQICDTLTKTLADIVDKYYHKAGAANMDEDQIVSFLGKIHDLIELVRSTIRSAELSVDDRFILSWAWYVIIDSIGRELNNSVDASMRLTGLSIQGRNIDFVKEVVDEFVKSKRNLK